MERRIAALVLVVGFVLPAHAADPNRADAVKKAAEEMGEAITKGDYGKIVDYTYPKTVEMLGGREKMMKFIEEQMKNMQANGAKILSCKFEAPGNCLGEEDNLFAIVPENLEIQVPKGKMIVKSYLLGVSADAGKTWKFIDGAGLDGKIATDKMLPKLPARLKLPEKQKPEFVAEK